MIKRNTQIAQEAMKTEEGRNILRSKRKKLLEAFDVYKTNVSYGLIEEDQESHQAITAWYRGLLDLDPEAFDDVPIWIQRFLK